MLAQIEEYGSGSNCSGAAPVWFGRTTPVHVYFGIPYQPIAAESSLFFRNPGRPAALKKSPSYRRRSGKKVTISGTSIRIRMHTIYAGKK